MAHNIAIIDCGTNTFHLLLINIKESGYSVVLKEKTVVKIGEGGINDKRITDEAKARALKALSDFKDKINLHEVSKVYAFATSAFRNATNGEALRQEVKETIGIDINIISGEEEASLIFKGVSWGLGLAKEKSLVMDIGGGSVEFIIGQGPDILWKRSFEIGAQRLLDLFHHNDPITHENLENLNTYLKTELSSLFEALKKYKPSLLIGSSGTFDTLSEIYCQKSGLQTDIEMKELPFPMNEFDSIYQELICKNRAERLKIPGMIEMRVDMIVVATALIKYVLGRHVFKEIRVSTYALKEGVLSEILKK